ncbi:MAG: hypothetical protein CSYNP_01146 [Syntrophus sp. SKADARSKE-3]|nr:hypothetical protein [Syntrophus sp. SKADARSKE-3]
MKATFVRKATISLIAVMMTFVMVQAVMAVPYFEAGTYANNSAPTSLVETYYGGNLAIYFTNQPVTGPGGDSIVGKYQSIGGLYTLASAGGNIYNLTLATDQNAVENYGTNTVKAQSGGGTVYFSALATALQINLNTHAITWSAVTGVNINNTIGSQALTDLAASSTYAFTTFNFESLGTESAWLSGATGSYNARYYSNLTGFSAAPEPGEWVLMLMGLGILGFYLHRRGYLSFESPQAAA